MASFLNGCPKYPTQDTGECQLTCTNYLVHPSLEKEYIGVTQGQGRGFSCREGCVSNVLPVAASVEQAARFPPHHVPPRVYATQPSSLKAREEEKDMPKTLSGLGNVRGTDRNRRVSSTLSPILYLFLAPTGKLYQKVHYLLSQDEKAKRSTPSVIENQRRPGPRMLAYGIPASQGPIVLHRVLKKKESLRKVADDYGVSHETIRRLIRSCQKK